MSICGFGAFRRGRRPAPGRMRMFLRARRGVARLPCVNLPPARTFMGDGGSVGLGFLAAAFGFYGIRAEIWPSWFPLLVFLPFAADATVTVLRRLARGDHLFEAHRTHYYQRLHQMGSGHRGTLLFYAVLIVGTSASALFTLAVAPGVGWSVTAAWMVAIGGSSPALTIIGAGVRQNNNEAPPKFPVVARLRPRPLRRSARLGLDVLHPLRPRVPRAVRRRHRPHARLDSPLQGAIFVAFGLYRGLWRFASLLDLQRIVFAAGLGALLIRSAS
jgi:hypothetical protein